MNDLFPINRRSFLVSLLGTGSATVLGFTRPAEAASVAAEPWTGPTGQQFTLWLTISPDGIATVRVTSPDIGNGVMTQASAFVHEALGGKWEDMRAEYASTFENFAMNTIFGDVGGALAYFSGRSTGDQRRITYMTFGAAAREKLKAAAATQLGVDVAELTVKDGQVVHAASGKSLPFGGLVRAAAQIQLATQPSPKPPEQWTFLGIEHPAKIQLPLIVNGTAVYGLDVRVPGMVYAALHQSPVMGGTLKSYDFAAIKNMRGVRAVVEVNRSEPDVADKIKPPFPFGVAPTQSAVAVIADHYWQARTALDALQIAWHSGPGAK